MSDEYASSIFASNIKLDISKSVRLFHPKIITHAFNLAKQMEAVIYNLPKKSFTIHKFLSTTQTLLYTQPTIIFTNTKLLFNPFIK